MTRARTVAGPGRTGDSGKPVTTVRLPADAYETARRATVVYADPGTVRRIRLHHRLKRLRRISNQLDRLLLGLPTVDPWTFSVPVADVYRAGRYGWPERDAAGRDLAERGWTP